MLDAPVSDSLFNAINLLPPIIMAAAGWGVIHWIALMALTPKNFIGIPPYIGWRGYFYTNQSQYINQWSRELLEPIASLQQIFERLSPEKIVQYQLDQLRPQLDTLIDDVMSRDHAVLWENLPILLKNRFYSRAHRLLPRIVDDIIEELNAGATTMLSYPKLLSYAEQNQPGTLKHMYRILSGPCFQGMGRYCALLGGITGILQVTLYHWLQAHHILYWSISSAFILFAFYWLAQRWVVSPEAPRHFGRLMLVSPLSRYRQKQNRELAQLLSNQVFSVSCFTGALLNDSATNHIQNAIKRKLASIVEDINIRTVIQFSAGPVSYAELKQTLSDTLASAFLEPLTKARFNEQRANVINGTLQTRLSEASHTLFFQQTNRILIPLSAIGGISGFMIGLAVGAVQYYLIQI